MAKAKLTLGLCAFCGVACASSFSKTLDGFMSLLVIGLVGSLVIGGIAWWVAGEIVLWWECRRKNPPVPHQRPRYRDDLKANQ